MGREEARAIARRMTSSVSGSDILKARRMMAQRDQQRAMGMAPAMPVAQPMPMGGMAPAMPVAQPMPMGGMVPAMPVGQPMHMGGMVHNPMAMNMANQMAAVELARRMTSSVSGSDILKAQAMLGMHQPRYY